MSELLAQAAAALNAPEAIVKRSAEARAKAGGISPDDVLAAWAGGGSAPAASAPAAPAPAPAPEPAAPEPSVDQSPPVAAISEVPMTSVGIADPLVVERVEIPEPVALGERVRTAGRIGALTGSVLGLLGALIGSPWLLTAASLTGSEEELRPSVLVTGSRFALATALLSVVFGLIVSTLSRTLTGWLRPGAALEGRAGVTLLIGAGSGAVLGLAAGSVMTSAFSEPVEGSEGLVALPVMSAVVVVLVGGALLGWITAALVQAVGVPANLSTSETRQVAAVRSRLASAIGVPLAGIMALAVLVIPFAFVLIRSNHMASGGAAVLAILVSASILGLAGLSASRPGMTIRRSEFVIALGGIGIVILIVVAVFLARSGGGHELEAEVAEEPAASFHLANL